MWRWELGVGKIQPDSLELAPERNFFVGGC